MQIQPFQSAQALAVTFLYSLTVFPATAQGTLDIEAIDLDFSTLARESNYDLREGRPSTSEPAAGTLPSILSRTLAQHRASAKPTTTDTEVGRAVDTRAAIAATWTARQQIEYFGQVELYEAGFYDALKVTLNSPLAGNWDYERGLESGQSATLATEVGRAVGLSQARLVAENIAFSHVACTLEIRGDSSLLHATERAPRSPKIHQLRLLDVFDKYPLAMSTEGPSGNSAAELITDPWLLYRSQKYDEFYSDRWQQPLEAFDYWLTHHRDQAAWSDLDSSERSRFAELFKATYILQLSDLLDSVGEKAYGQGHSAGWRYGSLVAHEWKFRQGHRKGFIDAMERQADSTFRQAYPGLYRDRYQELMQDSNRQASLDLEGTGPRGYSTEGSTHNRSP